MPAGNNVPPMLSWTKAKEVCTQQDFERLACALLNSLDTMKFNAETASAEFGCTPETFKTAVWKIANKIKKAKGDGSVAAPTPATPHSGKGGRKRKAEGEDGEEPKKRGKKTGGKKGQENDDDEIHVPIKKENGIGDDLEDEDGDLLK